ncbi:uncharacterized protein LOC131650347 [Vicia villosa]|uniref:uncharacterized protein LOC131650347 n=1 Tax=Vicia villosa TaxID=3911 RepID=UPI00273AF482|nr:uncharacterized protein LOC131650347 [Vicia villosa]
MAEQAGRGFPAPCRRGGRAVVDEQVIQDEVVEVEAVTVVQESVAVVEELVPVAEEHVLVAEEEVAVVKEYVPRVEELVAVVKEGVAEERVVHDTDIITGASTEPSVHTDGAFPGGLSDMSVLTRYADHVAYRIWQDEERLVLKLLTDRS